MRNLSLLFLIGLATGFLTEKLVSSQSSITPADDLYIEGQSSGGFPIDDEDGDDDGSGSGSGDYGFNSIPDLEESLRKFLNVSGTSTEEMPPLQPQPTAASPHTEATTAAAAAATTSQQPSVPVKDTETTPLAPSEEKEVPAVSPTDDSTTPRQDPAPESTAVPPSQTTAPDFSIDISVTKHNPEDNSLDQWDVRPTEDKVLVKQVENDIESSRGSRRLDPKPAEQVTSENMWERTEVLAAVIACGVVGFLCGVFLLLLLAYRMKKKDEGSYDLGDTKLSSTGYHKAPTKEFYA